jgi:hypothetical protein
MRLKYHRINQRLYPEQCPGRGFIADLRLIDNNLEAVFNRISGFWEIYRLSEKGWQWILQVEDSNGNYCPLDNRTLKKLREMDIISRHGSIDAFERHMDSKQDKYKVDEQKKMDHELKCDIKDDKVLWQRAMENFKSGVIG